MVAYSLVLTLELLHEKARIYEYVNSEAIRNAFMLRKEAGLDPEVWAHILPTLLPKPILLRISPPAIPL